MAQKTLAIGLLVLVAAICLSWSANHWIQTRTFDPVNLPVSLEAGLIRSGEFEINLRENYYVAIETDYEADDYQFDSRCSFRNLDASRWRVFRIRRDSTADRQLWAHFDKSEGPYWENLFRGVPGRYEVEWDVPQGATCLNARHPRLHVSTFSEPYVDFAAQLEYPFLLLGGTGAMLVLRALWYWLLVVAPKQQLRIFPQLVLKNVIAHQRHRPTPLIRDSSNFGLVWGGILYILMFIFAMNNPTPSSGLLLDLKPAKSTPAQRSPWPDTMSVYVDVTHYYVNGKQTARKELRSELLKALGKQMVWTVYFEADSECTFEEAAYAMDTIQEVGARLVWITPGVRKELSGNAKY